MWVTPNKNSERFSRTLLTTKLFQVKRKPFKLNRKVFWVNRTVSNENTFQNTGNITLCWIVSLWHLDIRHKKQEIPIEFVYNHSALPFVWYCLNFCFERLNTLQGTSKTFFYDILFIASHLKGCMWKIQRIRWNFIVVEVPSRSLLSRL